MSKRSYVVGLLGDGISGSLAKPLQEGEGEAQGFSLAYRLVDAAVLGFGVQDTADVLRWAVRLSFDALAITHPFKNRVMGCVVDTSEAAHALGASNLVLIQNGRTIAHNTDWLGFAEGLRATLPEVTNDRMVLLGAGGAGVAVGYGVLRYGAAHLDVVDGDEDRAEAVAARLGALVGTDRVHPTTDLEAALARAGGLIQATPVGMTGHPGLPLDPGLLRPDLWVADIIYFPLETELVKKARALACRVMTGGAMAVHQHAAAFSLITGSPADVRRMGANFARLTGQQVALSPISG